MTRMSGAEIAATRHLLGLTRAEFAAKLGVKSPHTVKDWESGRLTARETLSADIHTIRSRHDAEVTRLATAAADGTIIALPGGPEPQGWYLAIGARILDRVPDAILDWADRP